MKLNNYKYSIIIRSFLFVFLLFGMNMAAYAQAMSVAGNVTDQHGEPLIGVSIMVEGTTLGTVTDFDGNFTLNCPEGSMLDFSYISYTSQKLKAQPSMKVIMAESLTALDEITIVGIGYGTMRKSDLTGAISSVGQKDLKKGVVTSTEQMLQGKVSGLSVVQGSGDPSKGSTLRLRGGTSLSANSSPLVVVDGIPGVDINTVQPSEIVSIDVLKDASSSAIYGSRGANGVIIVTTNRSTANREVRKLEYNGYVAVGSVLKHMDLLSADQWRQYVRERDLIFDATDYGGNTDWQKELERTAITHSHNVYFSNINENSGYSASFTYMNSEGVIKNNEIERLSGSISAHQYALDRKLKVEGGITANRDNWSPIDDRIFERVVNLNPTVPVRDLNGKYTSIGGTNTENPVELNNNRFADDSRLRLLGYGKVEIEPVKGLKGVAHVSYTYNSYQRRLYIPTYAVMEGRTEKGRGERSVADDRTLQVESYITYDTEINKEHRLNVMGGYSYMNYMYEGFGATRRGFDTDMFNYDNLGAGTDYRKGDVYSYKGEAKTASFYGRANYSYLGKYMATATLRYDGSSRLGKNHKWGLFPSASVAWRVSEESFMESTKNWLDNLKLRFGYGVGGNQDKIGEYKSLFLLGQGKDGGGAYYDPVSNQWKQSYSPIQNYNPDLKWESTAQFNLGIDFGIINRISGSVELYYKKTSDLLWTYPVPQPPNLYGIMLDNVGDLVNKGVEFNVNANILRINDFSWDANMSLSYNHQEITKLSNDKYQASKFDAGALHGLRGFSAEYTQQIKEGYPVGAFFGPRCYGIDQEGNYIINTDDNDQPINEYLGSAQPKVNLGLSMSFTYKDFDLNLSGYGMFGQKVLNATYMSLYDPSRFPSQNVPDKFITSGITSKPTYSDYWVEKGDFFRFQSFTIGYTLPKNKSFGLQKIRVYFTGENICTLTGYTGLDPEVSTDLVLDTASGEVTTSPGMDMNNAYPRPRTFSLGLNISF